MVLGGIGFANGTIILDEPNAVYYAGQLMTGNVHFELNEPITFSAININYIGEASVQRTEGQNETYNGVKSYREIKYEGREQYFNIVQCAYGGTGISTLPAEVHSIPFQFQVPFNVPSSFKSEDGNITYRITAYMELLEPVRREEIETEFQVVTPLNLNTVGNMLKPLELDFEEIETCNCFCQSKPISLKVLLPAGVMNMGSKVPIVVKVKNDSSVEIYEMSFKITMDHTYRTTHPRSEYTAPEEVLAQLVKGPILSNTKREYSWDMQLPDVILPNLEGCSLMDVEFFFSVKIRMTGCNDDVEDESDIIIGLLPTSDPAELAQSSIAQHLPKGSIPNPNNPPAFAPVPIVSGPINVSNRSLNMIGTKEYTNTQAPQLIPLTNVSTPSSKSPYEIGFKAPNISPYPVPPGEIPSNPGFPPYPTIPNSGYPHPTPVAGMPYRPGQGMAEHNLSLERLSVQPSAPPL